MAQTQEGRDKIKRGLTMAIIAISTIGLAGAFIPDLMGIYLVLMLTFVPVGIWLAKKAGTWPR